MSGVEQLVNALEYALTHLYDPSYQPPPLLYELTACPPDDGALGVQSALEHVIQSLEPAPDDPAQARPRRIYGVLNCRYLLRLSQEETGERLSISVSTVRRTQIEGIHTLARLLWERYRAHTATTPGDVATRPGFQANAEDDWRQQIREELAALHRSAPGLATDVEASLTSVVELERVLAARRDVQIALHLAEPGLSIAIHPVVFRQLLVMIIGRLLERCSGSHGDIAARREGSQVVLELTGECPNDNADDEALIREILAIVGGSLDAEVAPDRLVYRLHLPGAGHLTVLVVEDNPDMVYFYERCVRGTKYQIVHEDDGPAIFDAIARHAPDMVVLDLMLSKLDGWQVLANLHHHPTTSAIPVIVCSVIREDNLAFALGAAQVLHKPVAPAEFIAALERVSGRGLSSPLQGPPKTAESDRE